MVGHERITKWKNIYESKRGEKCAGKKKYRSERTPPNPRSGPPKRGDHHFIVAQRPDEQQWTLTLYSTSVKDPAGNEDQLDEYLAASQEDAKALAQGLVEASEPRDEGVEPGGPS